MIAAASMVAAGAVAMAQIDDGPSIVTEPVVVAEQPLGSMYRVVDQIGARSLWEQGVTGAGVNVAVIDTGVAAVDELTAPGKLVAAVDLSSEQSDQSAAYLDSFGHGTHVAGIIAGRQVGADPALADQHPEWFLGVAPDAGIVSVKVAGRDGTVSLSSLITGIDWVIANADELDIRVINLAFNGDSGASYLGDPLTAAVERAWNAGIVVVTAAGNSGADAQGLGSPATDPFVIAVGGLEATDTGFVTPDWTSRGDGVRNPDLAAPGAHIESLRAPGSMADLDHPEGFVDQQRFLASGSSQSAAVTAGAVALLLEARPELSPDQVKRLLVDSADPISQGDPTFTGAGALNVAAAALNQPVDAGQTWTPAAADITVPTSPGVMSVIFDPTGSSWMGSSWMGSSWMGSSWMGSSWMGSSWMGSSWMGSSWMGSSWMGSSWMGSSWMGSSWMGSSWMGSSWMGSSWMGSSWMGSSWMGSSWMGSSWMGSSWMGSSWMGSSWMGSSWMGSSWMGSSWMGSSWM